MAGSGCAIFEEGGTSADPDVRCPGVMSDDSRPGGMSYATRRKGGGLRGQKRGSHAAIFGEDPTLTTKSPELSLIFNARYIRQNIPKSSQVS